MFLLVAALSKTDSMFHNKFSSPLHHRHHPQLLSSLVARQDHLLLRPLHHLITHRQSQPVTEFRCGCVSHDLDTTAPIRLILRLQQLQGAGFPLELGSQAAAPPPPDVRVCVNGNHSCLAGVVLRCLDVNYTMYIQTVPKELSNTQAVQC